MSRHKSLRSPDFAPSSETPGGYVGQAVLVVESARLCGADFRGQVGVCCLDWTVGFIPKG
jgi:hypothetical protein